MMDFCLQNNDLAIANGDLIVSPTESDTLAQNITIRLKTLLGEWFFDTSIGIPYLTEIFGHKRNERFIRQLIIPEIESVPGIQQIKDFKVQEETHRKIVISFTAFLSNGANIFLNESIGV
jgi:hypothetical protein